MSEKKNGDGRIVVTGLGVISPLGNNVADTWNHLVAGRAGSAPITRFDATDFTTRFACEVKEFVPEDVIDRKDAKRMDRFVQFGVAAARSDRQRRPGHGASSIATASA